MNGAPTKTMLALAVVLLGVAGPAASHKYFYSGDCPQLEALKDFDMAKFLGDWFVNQQTSSSARCLVNNYALNPDKLGTFKLEQSSVHQVLGLTSKDGRWRYYGEVSPRENATGRGDLQVKYSLNPGTAKYTILATDYDNYASIVSCQDLPIGYRISSSILSRKRTLEPKLLEQARNVLSKNGMEIDILSSLEQGEVDCQPPKSGEGFHGAVQRAGDVINQGVQAVKEGAIKLYNKVRGHDGSAESMEASGANGNYTTVIGVNKDAEWLP